MKHFSEHASLSFSINLSCRRNFAVANFLTSLSKFSVMYLCGMKEQKKQKLELVAHQNIAKVKCCVANSADSLKKIIDDDKKKVWKVMRQLQKKAGPAWYQELSENQITAAESIHVALACPTEKDQIKDCRVALRKLGVSSRSDKLDLLAAIKFSRGNDLAFLWSIYDRKYNFCGIIEERKSFSVDERLILSSICHLDMITTLRELDRILPKPKKRILRIAPKCQAVLPPSHRLRCESPYLEPAAKFQPQPSPIIPRSQYPQPKFQPYVKYKNPSFIIPNESNRWFEKENLLPSKSLNIARGIVCDQINQAVAGGRIESKKISINLCEKHRLEAEKFHRILQKLLNHEMPKHIDQDYLKHCDASERGITHDVQMELLRTENDYANTKEKSAKQLMMQTLLRQIVENAADLKHIHLCRRCEDCVMPKDLLVEKPENSNVDLQKISSNDANAIKFFHRPSTSSPFQFDYEKIFAMNFLTDCGVVRNSINVALELDKHLTVDNAITVCLRDMWQFELKLWNEKRAQEVEEKRSRLVPDCYDVGKSKQKAFSLLRKGIDEMRKNPKFVLVTLPDAARLPILREWVLQRFGFRHDATEDEKLWKANKLQREYLEALDLMNNLKVPSLKQFGITKLDISISERRNAIKKRDEWMKKYHKELAGLILDRNRLYWTTMEPQLCESERMKKIFSSYLPSRGCEIDKIVMNNFE